MGSVNIMGQADSRMSVFTSSLVKLERQLHSWLKLIFPVNIIRGKDKIKYVRTLGILMGY